eukprot:s187_g17.t1
MDSRLAKNLAKLDKAARRTTVFVSSLDQRLLQTKNVLKGKTWLFQAHGQCETWHQAQVVDSGASTATEELCPDDLRPADFVGCWLDSNGNTIHVIRSRASSSWLVAHLNRSGQRQLRLNLWRSEGTSQWICGNARLEECARDQLLWRFGSGRTSTWIRSEAVGNHQAWQNFSLEDGYGPWQNAPAGGKYLPRATKDDTPGGHVHFSLGLSLLLGLGLSFARVNLWQKQWDASNVYKEFEKRRIRKFTEAGYHVGHVTHPQEGVQLGKDDENLAVDPKAMEQLAKEPVLLRLDRSGRAIKEGDKVDGFMPWSLKDSQGLHSAQAPKGWEDFYARYGKMDKGVEGTLGPRALTELQSNLAQYDGKDDFRVIRTLSWAGGVDGGGPTSIMLIGMGDMSTRSARLAARAVYEVQPSGLMVELCRERIGKQLVIPAIVILRVLWVSGVGCVFSFCKCFSYPPMTFPMQEVDLETATTATHAEAESKEDLDIDLVSHEALADFFLDKNSLATHDGAAVVGG